VKVLLLKSNQKILNIIINLLDKKLVMGYHFVDEYYSEKEFCRIRIRSAGRPNLPLLRVVCRRVGNLGPG
jgi:hypothetical protein